MYVLRFSRRTVVLAITGLFALLVAAASVMYYHRAAASDYISCRAMGDLAERYRCWDRTIKNELEGDDVARALGQLKYFSGESPDFVQTCHTLAHKVGERAYQDFAAGRGITITADTQVCDFGFYHGFMTKFLADSREYSRLGLFCTTLRDTDANGDLYALRWACFHGIGHGSVAEYDVSAWSNGSIKPLTYTISICRMAAQSQADYIKCVAGAYNGMSYGTYKEIIDPKDPFKICRQVSDADIPSECYANFALNVINFTDHRTIQEAIALAAPYTPREYLLVAIPTFADKAARKLDTQHDFTCMQLAADEVTPCMRGFISGLVQLEVFDTKERRAFALCASNLVSDALRTQCYRDSLDTLSNFWSQEQIETSCTLAPEQGRAACWAALPKRSM